MQGLLFGILALTLTLMFTRGFARANPTIMARQLRRAGGVAALGAGALLLLRGMVSYAMPLFMLGSWLLTGSQGLNWGPLVSQSRRFRRWPDHFSEDRSPRNGTRPRYRCHARPGNQGRILGASDRDHGAC